MATLMYTYIEKHKEGFVLCADIKAMSCSVQTFSPLISCLTAVCSPIMSSLLNCIIETIHVTESRVSLPRGPPAARGQRFGQPCFK